MSHEKSVLQAVQCIWLQPPFLMIDRRQPGQLSAAAEMGVSTSQYMRVGTRGYARRPSHHQGLERLQSRVSISHLTQCSLLAIACAPLRVILPGEGAAGTIECTLLLEVRTRLTEVQIAVVVAVLQPTGHTAHVWRAGVAQLHVPAAVRRAALGARVALQRRDAV